MLLPRGTGLGEPRGSPCAAPKCAGPPAPAGQGGAETAQGPCSGERGWAGWLQDGSGMVLGLLPEAVGAHSRTALMGTAAPLSWHGTARHGMPAGLPGELLPGKPIPDGHTCSARSLSRHSTGSGLLWPGEVATAPEETLARPAPGPVPSPARCPAPVPSLPWVSSSAVSPPGLSRGGGTDLCRCRGCSSSFWKQTKQKESIAQARWPPRPGEGDRRAGSAGGVLASSSPVPAVAGGSRWPSWGHGGGEPVTRPG